MTAANDGAKGGPTANTVLPRTAWQDRWVTELLVVSHSKTGGTAQMLEAVLAGAHDPAIEGVRTRAVDALDATASDVRSADAVILGTPENFGYMSGALKHFFDSVFYELGDDTAGLPHGVFVKAGNDGSGALRAIEPLTTGLRWRLVQPPVLAVGELTPDHLASCTELGATIAAGLATATW